MSDVFGPSGNVLGGNAAGAAASAAAAAVAASKPTMTLKTGSGAGNYTTDGAAYANMDGTNLSYTAVIPTGWKLSVNAWVNAQNSLLNSANALAIADGGVVVCETTNEWVAGIRNMQVLGAIIAGDGTSHVITLQYKTSAGTTTVSNASASVAPRMMFLLTPSG